MFLSHGTQNRSFQGCSFQPISWLVLRMKNVRKIDVKNQTQAFCSLVQQKTDWLHQVRWVPSNVREAQSCWWKTLYQLHGKQGLSKLAVDSDSHLQSIYPMLLHTAHITIQTIYMYIIAQQHFMHSQTRNSTQLDINTYYKKESHNFWS